MSTKTIGILIAVLTVLISGTVQEDGALMLPVAVMSRPPIYYFPVFIRHKVPFKILFRDGKPPYIDKVQIFPNESLSLDCGVDAHFYPLNYTWYRNNKILPKQPYKPEVLSIKPDFQNKIGNSIYKCIVCNEKACATRYYYVTISGRNLEDLEIQACVGESVDLVCELYDVRYTIEWYGPYRLRPNSTYDPDGDLTAEVVHRGQLYQKGNLNLTHSGWYLCDTWKKNAKWMRIYLNVTNGPMCQHP